MTEDPEATAETEEIATFLAGVEAFKTLSPDQLSRVAAAVTHRSVRGGRGHDRRGQASRHAALGNATARWISCAGTPWSP